MSSDPVPTPTPYLDPQNVAIGAKTAALLNGRQPQDLPLADLRALFREVQSPAPKDPNVSISHFNVKTTHGEVKTFIYRPKHSDTEDLPFVYHLHGGGWIFGSAFIFDAFLLDLVNRTGVAVVFPEYTLAPEQRFPAQQEQCLEVLQWILEKGHSKNLLTDKFVLSGDSAGGQLASALSILNAQRKLHLPITHQILWHPVVDASPSLAKRFSQFLFQDGPLEGNALFEEYFADYFGPAATAKERASILASPINMTAAQAKDFMPPTTIITAQADWLRDQDQDFAKLLQTSGVACGVVQMVAVLHDAAVLDLARDSPTVELVMLAVAGKIREVLGVDGGKGEGQMMVQNGHGHGGQAGIGSGEEGRAKRKRKS